MQNIFVGPRNVLGFETITVSTTAIGCTSTQVRKFSSGVRQEATSAFFTAEGANARYRMDGTDPTASVGHLLNSGEALTVDGLENLTKLRFIRDDATDVTLSVTYFG